MTRTGSPKLSRLHSFFNTYGRERLDGLDSSYFRDMSPDESAEAWYFMSDRFAESVDKITGLYLLDQVRAIEQFKRALDSPMPSSEYPATRRADEINRLLMLRYVTSSDTDPRYIAMLPEFARSEFEEVRAQFAQSLSVRNATTEVVTALKEMFYSEAELLALASAIFALKKLHGWSYDPSDSRQRSIYMLLQSTDPEEKRAGMSLLEKGPPE